MTNPEQHAPDAGTGPADGGIELFVPGRICLFGEHSDWAGGYRASHPALEKGHAILTGTDQGIRARVRRHPDMLIVRLPVGGPPPRRSYAIPMNGGALRTEAERGGFASYVAGVAHQVAQRYPVGGLIIDQESMDLPIRKGLSSSAAACVLTARAFNRLYNLGLTIREEMELAYLGERTTPSQCGRLDQGCAYGGRPVLMTFDGEGLEVEEIRMARDLHLVIVDLASTKDTREILRSLNGCYPVARGERARAVQAYLGPINAGIVAQARSAMEAGDAEAVGRLMTEAQRAFDAQVAPACPGELAAPVLHRVLASEALRPYALGGKGVGSQGDGAAQLVVRDAVSQGRVIEIVRERLGMLGLGVTIPATGGGAAEARG